MLRQATSLLKSPFSCRNAIAAALLFIGPRNLAKDLVTDISMKSWLLNGGIALILHSAEAQETRPKALVYRSSPDITCEDCPETVARLLESSPAHFNVSFAGPEDLDVDEDSFNDVTVFAFPGGPDLVKAYQATSHFQLPLRNWVAGGGRYLGFCLGAYLAGKSPGYGLVPNGTDVLEEIDNPDSPVQTDEDTVIQVDWTFRNGSTEDKRWLYFQDGAYITEFNTCDGHVLAKYSDTGDIAASVTKYGRGWVGLTGPHPEADQTWYDDAELSNPDGIHRDFALDLLAATLDAKEPNCEDATPPESTPHVTCLW